MSHHTPEQVDRAFANLPNILRKLEEAGVENPSVEMHSDGSGRLVLGQYKDITEEQVQLASDLVSSHRWGWDHHGNFTITSCCGFVSAGEVGS